MFGRGAGLVPAAVASAVGAGLAPVWAARLTTGQAARPAPAAPDNLTNSRRRILLVYLNTIDVIAGPERFACAGMQPKPAA